jgi:hypothetical protein
MADLNQHMGAMGINDSAHAGGAPTNNAGPPVKQAYIPPHMRATMGRGSPAPAPAPAPAPGGTQASRWAANGYVLKHPPFCR